MVVRPSAIIRRARALVGGSERESDATLTERVVSGAAWSLFAQLFVQGTRIAVAVTLARLLTPREFGVAGMAIVFSTLASIFTDLSLGAALIQRPNIDERDRSTIFWTTAALGVVTAIVGVALSEPIAAFFDEPQVRSLFAVLSIGFLLNALGVTQWALLTRQMAYRSLQLREMAGIAVGAVVGITVAFLGYGPWAIVGQAVSAAAVSLLLLWRISTWRPRPVFSLASLREVGTFGVKLFGSRLLSYGTLNADNLLVGRFLGAAPLGVYALAYNVMFTPVVRLAMPIHLVLFPAYSRLQDDEPRLVRAWLRSKRVLAAALIPIFLAMVALAPDLVQALFGARWAAAVPIIRLLACAGVAHAFVALNWSLLQARGRAGALLWVNALTAAATIGAFAGGLHWGLRGVAGFFALAKWLLILPDVWITTRSLRVRRREVLLAGGDVLPVALAASGVAWGVRLLLVDAGLPSGARLVLAAGAGLALYVGLVYLVLPSLAREFGDLVRRRDAAP